MPDPFPLQLLLATFAGWVNCHQAQVIEYLVDENRLLKEPVRAAIGLRTREHGLGARSGLCAGPRSAYPPQLTIHLMPEGDRPWLIDP